jgi:predicted transposase/invertase (TIGR01784 family)
MKGKTLKLSEKYMNPFNDHAFKVIFGCEKNKSLLIDFLNNLLKGEREIVDVQYLDKEQILEQEKRRSAVYDIYCKDRNGDYFIVEMQNSFQDNFVKRMVYYSAFSIAKQGEQGSSWNYDVKAVYNIAFLNFKDSRIGNELVKMTSLRDNKTGEQLTDVLNLIFIQLPLFNKTVEQCENFFERWIYVLKNMYVLENLPKSFQCEAFKKLKEVSDVSKLNSTELSRYERAQRDYWDLINVLNSAEKNGIEKGKAEGRAEGEAKGEANTKLSIARNMKAKRYPVEDISDMTGLSIEEVNAISLN